jgi:uncharacterized protein YuzE
MKISYDPKYNIAYIKLREKTTEVETIRISEELNIDITPNGEIYGIELLNANEQLEIVKNGGLILIDESTGKKVTLEVNYGGRNL